MVWRYQFEADNGGTSVTESYEVTRPITPVGWFIITNVFGCSDRRSELHDGMQETMTRLQALTAQPAS